MTKRRRASRRYHRDAIYHSEEMQNALALIAWNLKRLCRKHRISLEEWAEKSGVSRRTLTRANNPQSNTSINLTTIVLLASALGVPLVEFFQPIDNESAGATVQESPADGDR